MTTEPEQKDTSTPPVAVPAEGKGGGTGAIAVKLAAIIVPLVAVVAFMLRPSIGDESAGTEIDTGDPDNDKLAAFARCVKEVRETSTEVEGARGLDLSGASTKEEIEKRVQRSGMSEAQQSLVLEKCAAFLPATGGDEVARLTVVEGEHADPVTSGVKLSIEVAGKPFEPNSAGQIEAAYDPKTCGQQGCAVVLVGNSIYELAEADARYAPADLKRGAVIKLRRKADTVDVALGARADTPYVWVVSTNADATLWRSDCQPNDESYDCRRVKAEAGNARFRARGELRTVTLRLSRDGDDWGEEIAVDAASALKDRVLRLPEPTAPPTSAARPAAPCLSDTGWFRERLMRFTDWDDDRTLTVRATATADGVTGIAADQPLSAGEQSKIARYVGKPPGAAPGCRPTPVQASVRAKAQR